MMDRCIWALGRRTRGMGRESSSNRMELAMKVTGRMIKFMGKERRYYLMVANT